MSWNKRLWAASIIIQRISHRPWHLPCGHWFYCKGHAGRILDVRIIKSMDTETEYEVFEREEPK